MCVYKIVSCKNLKHIKYQTIYKCYSLSRAQLFATPWTAAHQAPPSMRFSRQGYWSGVPFPSPGDLPNPGIEPAPPALAGRFFTTAPPGNPCFNKNPDKLMLYNLLIYPLNLFLKKKIVF